MPKEPKVEKKLEEAVKTSSRCGECDGEKSANGKTPCSVCNGTGEVK